MSKPSHLISAKLTTEAFEIYNRHKANRRGGHAISAALVSWANQDNNSRAIQKEIKTLQDEIQYLKQGNARIQALITRIHGERDELADELRELFTPAYPSQPLESVGKDLDSESS
jgi:septal ring factor EnvC (AmiA/AmiB activator)